MPVTAMPSVDRFEPSWNIIGWVGVNIPSPLLEVAPYRPHNIHQPTGTLEPPTSLPPASSVLRDPHSLERSWLGRKVYIYISGLMYLGPIGVPVGTGTTLEWHVEPCFDQTISWSPARPSTVECDKPGEGLLRIVSDVLWLQAVQFDRAVDCCPHRRSVACSIGLISRPYCRTGIQQGFLLSVLGSTPLLLVRERKLVVWREMAEFQKIMLFTHIPHHQI